MKENWSLGGLGRHRRWKVTSSRLETSSVFGRPEFSTPGTVYQVRQCLPAGPDGDVLYRVKAFEELHERIARQAELIAMAAPQPRR